MFRGLGSFAALSALSAQITWTTPGLARDEATQRCLDAYESAQFLKREGGLVEAREKLIYCASTECPQAMHGDCERWLTEVDASIPTVVFQVQTPSGATSRPWSVAIDGSDPVTLDGRAMRVNPGKHQVTFSAEGLQTTSKVLLFAEGEKLRHEVVVLKPRPGAGQAGQADEARDTPHEDGAEESLRSSGIPTVPVILASSVALAGGAGFAYFGLTARAEDRRLDDCVPACTQERVDAVKYKYLLANVSLGVGAAGLVASAVLVALGLRNAEAPHTASIGLSAHPSAHGLSVTGSF